ncbi:hypothetical protein PROFUN_00421 [Planoprotostelium fungivorum]|uniref:Uncharacterized protein n=1 Tax=Planoprotostelium fungivorum TaxID=1890364 RepID=A0A2P6N0Y3_9EUKA|nr:hypothetical protein PROFUN_00421 [Planoprotostelium fungivorum]
MDGRLRIEQRAIITLCCSQVPSGKMNNSPRFLFTQNSRPFDGPLSHFSVQICYQSSTAT